MGDTNDRLLTDEEIMHACDAKDLRGYRCINTDKLLSAQDAKTVIRVFEKVSNLIKVIPSNQQRGCQYVIDAGEYCYLKDELIGGK